MERALVSQINFASATMLASLGAELFKQSGTSESWSGLLQAQRRRPHEI